MNTSQTMVLLELHNALIQTNNDFSNHPTSSLVKLESGVVNVEDMSITLTSGQTAHFNPNYQALYSQSPSEVKPSEQNCRWLRRVDHHDWYEVIRGVMCVDSSRYVRKEGDMYIDDAKGKVFKKNELYVKDIQKLIHCKYVRLHNDGSFVTLPVYVSDQSEYYHYNSASFRKPPIIFEKTPILNAPVGYIEDTDGQILYIYHSSKS